MNSPNISRTVKAFADTLINKYQNYRILKNPDKAWIGDKSDKFLERHKTITDSRVGREKKLSCGRIGKLSTMDRQATFLAGVEPPKSC